MVKEILDYICFAGAIVSFFSPSLAGLEKRRYKDLVRSDPCKFPLKVTAPP